VLALTGFIVGATLGTTLTDADQAAAPWPALVTIALALEGVVLVVVAIAWAALPPRTEVALGAFIVGTAIAMGLQSAAARKLAVPGVSTVVLTSTLTSLVARTVAHIRHRRWADPKPQDWTKGPAILFGVWGAYVIGAGLGTWLTHLNLPLAIVPPAALVSLVALTAWRACQRVEGNKHVGG
jgi:uncharacterized membrane protein YoaK (UPF0700 family)